MEYRNAQWLDNGLIDCEINHPEFGWIPFTCNPTEDHPLFSVSDLYEEMSEVAATFVQKPQSELDEEAAAAVRSRRDLLLSQSDWVVTKAIEQNAQDGLGVQIPVVWLDYRQALRDVPSQADFPHNVNWPVKP